MTNFHLLNQLIDAENELKELKAKLEKLEQSEPEGHLLVRNNKNSAQHYHITDNGNKYGQYLGKDKQDLIKALAQKKFNHMLQEAADKELDGIRKCKKTLAGCSFSAASLANKLPQQIRQYVDTDLAMNQRDVEKWLCQEYEFNHPHKGKDELTTLNGENVRSKSEIIIADRLKHYKVPYIYEKSFDEGMQGKYRDFPDFTCLNKRTGKTYYWEHCGKFDDPKYTESLMLRIQRFASEGVYLGSELIITMETSQFPLNTSYVDKMIKKYLL